MSVNLDKLRYTGRKQKLTHLHDLLNFNMSHPQLDKVRDTNTQNLTQVFQKFYVKKEAKM